jgi:hypothetical protein
MKHISVSAGFFFDRKQQGKPLCTEILLKGNREQTEVIDCTLRLLRAKQRKKEELIYRTNKKLAIQLYKALEGQLLVITHSNCLKVSFFDETQLPSLKGGSNSTTGSYNVLIKQY